VLPVVQDLFLVLEITDIAEIHAARDLCGREAQQFLANHKQVHQGAGGKQSIAVLLESSVAYLHESKFQFQWKR